MFKPFVIVAYVSLSCHQCENGSQNHTVTAEKCSNMKKMLGNQRTHEQASQNNIRRAFRHSIENQVYVNF